MKYFDEYTRSHLSHYLTEQAPPANPKKGQIAIIDGNRYVYSDDGRWLAWNENTPHPFSRDRGERKVSGGPKSSGMGSPKGSHSIPLPPGATLEDRQAQARAQTFGSTFAPSGYDIQNQILAVRAREALENYLKGMTSGYLATLLDKAAAGAQALGPRGSGIAKTAAGAAAGFRGGLGDKAAFMTQQLLRTIASKAYAGAGNPKDLYQAEYATNFKSADTDGLVALGLAEIMNELNFDQMGFAGSTGISLVGVGRFGQRGMDFANEAGTLALLGYDPFDIALKRLGAYDTKSTYETQLGPPNIGSMGGYLQRGQESGVYRKK